MTAIRQVYRVIRSILFSVVLTALGFVVLAYTLLSLPSVTEAIKQRAEKELSSLLGGKVTIGEAEIFPFNEVRLYDVSIYSPQGQRCISVQTLGAGIELIPLIDDGDVVITYAELIGLHGIIEQRTADSPLNIQFIIDAFKQDKKKEPSKVKVVLHNVVIRKSAFAFRRPYLSKEKDVDSEGDNRRFDIANIELYNVNADVALPNITNDDIRVDLRRLAFVERSGINVRTLALKADITPQKISLSDFSLKFGSSDLTISDQTIEFNGYNDLVAALKRNDYNIGIVARPLYLSDFTPFVPQLEHFNAESALKIGVSGSLDHLNVNEFDFHTIADDCHLLFAADVTNLLTPKEMTLNLERFDARVTPSFSENLCHLFPAVPAKVSNILKQAGIINVNASGRVDVGDSSADAIAEVKSGVGNIDLQGDFWWKDGGFSARGLSAVAENFNLGLLTDIKDLGHISLDAKGDIAVRNKDIQGTIEATIPYVEVRGNRVDNIAINAEKRGDRIAGYVDIADETISLDFDADIALRGDNSLWDIDVALDGFIPAAFGIKGFGADQSVSTRLAADIQGIKPDFMEGEIRLSHLALEGGKYPLSVKEVYIFSDIEEVSRNFRVKSDFLNGRIEGDFVPQDLIALVSNIVAQTVPVLVNHSKPVDTSGQYADIALTIEPSENLYHLLKAPITPGVPINISAHINGDNRNATLDLDAPYIIQNDKKLLKNTRLNAVLYEGSPTLLSVGTNYPIKDDRIELTADITALDDDINAALKWKMVGWPNNVGDISLNVKLLRELLTNALAIEATVQPSEFSIRNQTWSISPATIKYADKRASVNNLHIAHGTQFLDINGAASEDPMDILTADLAGIDLQYIFNVLNINYVDFGGFATGRAVASNLFSGSPVARTQNLFVRNFSYNDCKVGDANLEGFWDNDERMVGINADINDDLGNGRKAHTEVHGGIYVTRDSLSLDFIADKTDMGLLKPFMANFTSDVRGRASGKVRLEGTFVDLDLDGYAFADTIEMKVDHTNVYYGGSDSVFFSKGLISIPRIRLYDKYGHSGLFSGEVHHDFLRDASFHFSLQDARNLLLYDTNASSGMAFYGRVFGSGNARLTGDPYAVNLDIDMATTRGTEFTIALDQTEQAAVYTFLTFSDKQKEAKRTLQPVAEDAETFEKRFAYKKKQTEHLDPADFNLNLALTVTPGANLVLIMDPTTGDKIRATGNGALQMGYTSHDDQFSIYGKYILDKGTYNFSLQDLILKNFTIQEGSSITFNGDPEDGILDITAAYRVNTNLADLDASFRDDPDLQRTSVPVDALLKVKGELDQPEIKFDISLPTVTSEVERKMRSIVSTEDMMNQQVIYLLALNRFYSPEYSGGEQGGEFASVASSTISSQIQNLIGSVTDKFSLAPSIKSERSDLSDMEFDVALSTKFFDDRLLINGNLGYRDKSTSNTTFIGDFDIEYLLNRRGNFRLKAYNHFNDASYYLKSALTTQGVGIIYRKSF